MSNKSPRECRSIRYDAAFTNESFHRYFGSVCENSRYDDIAVCGIDVRRLWWREFILFWFSTGTAGGKLASYPESGVPVPKSSSGTFRFRLPFGIGQFADGQRRVT